RSSPVRRRARLHAHGNARRGHAARRRHHGPAGRARSGEARLSGRPPAGRRRSARRHPASSISRRAADDHEGRPSPQSSGVVKRSTDRILTTHTGSLPRPRDLLTLLQEREEGRLHGEGALRDRTRSAVLDIVRKQAEIGLSVINDGEQGRADYTIYVKDRLTGFSGESTP